MSILTKAKRIKQRYWPDLLMLLLLCASHISDEGVGVVASAAGCRAQRTGGRRGHTGLSPSGAQGSHRGHPVVPRHCTHYLKPNSHPLSLFCTRFSCHHD